ncbi:uncharacterized protein [Petaurus breviceps papuanus]|uniref:uncharacterized protein n=1 Tax=Petaurus breviceps papuanus TaxID=3040969 RepID=UPI0036DC788A
MDRRILEVQKFLESGALPDHLVTATQKRDFRRRAQNFSLEGDNLMFIRPGKKLLVVLDRKQRQELVKQAHVPSSGLHCTLQETRKKVSVCYYWPHLDQDVTKWVKQCNCFQKSRLEKSLPIQSVPKSHRSKDPLPVLQVEEVTQAFEQVGLGLVGPLVETSSGFRFILLSVDAYSRWVEASPLKEQNPVEVAWALIPFLLRFGRPQLLVTTLRVPFVSQVNRSLRRQLQGLGVPLGKLDIIMSAFQPKINSILSLTSSSIRRTLWSLVKGDLEKWDCVLDKALFSLRTAVTKNKRRSPFQLLYGRKPRAPQDVPSHFDVVAADTVGDSVGDSREDKEHTETAETMKHSLTDAVPKPIGKSKEENSWEPPKPPRQEPMLDARQQPMLEARQQPMLEPMSEPRQQPMPEARQQPMLEPMPEPRQQPMLESMPEARQQPMLEPMQQPMPEVRQQPMQLEPRQQPMPEPMLEPTQQPMPEARQQLMQLEPTQQSRPETMGLLIHQPMMEPINQHMWQPVLGSIHQPIQQSMIQSTHQPIHPSIQQPMTQSAYQLITQSTYQPMTQSTYQPMIQSTYQPMTQSIQQPMTLSIQQPMSLSIQQPITQTIQQPMTQSIQQPMHQSMQQPMTQPIQQPIMAEPMHPPMVRLAECPVVSSWGQRTAPSLDTPWEKWEPGGGAFWTQWREPGN